MLNSQFVVNLLPQLRAGVDLGRHGTGLVKDSGAARDGFYQRLGGIVDVHSCHERTEWPNEGTPNGGTQVLGVYATPRQLDCFAALAFQQHGEQPTLCNGLG